MTWSNKSAIMTRVHRLFRPSIDLKERLGTCFITFVSGLICHGGSPTPSPRECQRKPRYGNDGSSPYRNGLLAKGSSPELDGLVAVALEGQCE